MNEAPEIISRKEAKASGLRYYFTGKACPQGHLSERLVFNSSCRACQREANRPHPKGQPLQEEQGMYPLLLSAKHSTGQERASAKSIKLQKNSARSGRST
jgi:hypothetical protein